MAATRQRPKLEHLRVRLLREWHRTLGDATETVLPGGVVYVPRGTALALVKSGIATLDCDQRHKTVLDGWEKR